MWRAFPAFFAILFVTCPVPGFAAQQVDFKTFLESPENYHGEEILVSGFLSLEDYGKALFLTQEDYAQGRFENSVPIIMSRNILDRREAFQRTFVKIRAVYNHDCARPGMFCSAHPGQGVLGPVLELWGERLPENERPIYRKPALETVWDRMTVSEAENADHESLIRLARKFFEAVKTKDRDDLLALFEKDGRKRMAADLQKSPSRSDWLLFNGQYNYRDAFRAAQLLTIIPLRMKDDPLKPPVAAACYCLSVDCLERLSDPMSSHAVVEGSFVDPWKCVPFYKRDEKWVIDDGFLLSTDEEAPYGYDLGIMMKDDNMQRKDGEAVAARFFTHPRYSFSAFLTRLRERPRPRVVNAMRKGRLKLPVYFMAASGSTYSLNFDSGTVSLEKLKLDK